MPVYRLCLGGLVLLASLPALPGQETAPGQTGEGRAGTVPRKETEGSKRLWGALVYAVEEAGAKRPGYVEADAALEASLKKVFTEYAHFQVLGTRAEALFKNTHSWVAPSKQLCVKFDSKGLTKDGQGVRLDLQLWNRGKAIVKTDAILRPGSPVFIEGPSWGKGKLLYVLKLLDGEQETDGSEAETAKP